MEGGIRIWGRERDLPHIALREPVPEPRSSNSQFSAVHTLLKRCGINHKVSMKTVSWTWTSRSMCSSKWENSTCALRFTVWLSEYKTSKAMALMYYRNLEYLSGATCVEQLINSKKRTRDTAIRGRALTINVKLKQKFLFRFLARNKFVRSHILTSDTWAVLEYMPYLGGKYLPAVGL